MASRPQLFEQLAHEIGHGLLVVDHQHAPVQLGLAPAGRPRGPRRRRVAAVNRKQDAEAAPRAGRARHDHVTAVLVHDAVHRGEPHAAAAPDILGSEERLEHALENLGADAGARVGDLQLDEVAAEALAAARADGFPRQLGRVHGDFDAADSRHRVASVDREIEDLVELHGSSMTTGPCARSVASSRLEGSELLRSLSDSATASASASGRGEPRCPRLKVSICWIRSRAWRGASA